jgi:single-stranded-DNA-specific exonuclease
MIWQIKEQKAQDLVEQLLINRGLKKKEDIEAFFTPKLEYFQKQIQLPGITKTLKRIDQAIEKQELIIVYGDYDVDGVCASAIMYKSLTALGAKILPYIPHREKEGYGLSKTGLEFARDSGASLVITVDNGIVALDQALFAKEIGLELIITDHHLPLETLPEAFSIVHSTQMCGTAVAWCLMKDKISETLAKELLELVAIATIADLMPLMGINRSFVWEGLKVLNKTKNIGLQELIRQSGVEIGKITAYEIGHVISPRINAIGRLEHAIDALRLVCTKDPIKARRLAKLLCDTNTKRQQITMQSVDEARLMIQKDKRVHVMWSDKWNPGIIGLIAGRITEDLYSPSLAISVADGKAKGSARSIDGINIVEVLRQTSDLLIDIGGHSGAAGFSLEEKNLEAFKIRVESLVENIEVISEKVLNIEAEVDSEMLSKSLVKKLDQFAPFGYKNPPVLLATRGMQISEVRTLSDGKHLKFRANGIDAIAFGMGDLSKKMVNTEKADIAYTLEINEFRGNQNLQLKVKDILISE